MHFAGRNLGHASSLYGIPIVSDEGKQWIEERTGEVFYQNPEAGHDYRGRRESPLSPQSLISPGGHARVSSSHRRGRWSGSNKAVDLPPRAVTERLFHIYDGFPLRSIFSVVHKGLFFDTMDRAYSQPTDASTEKRYGVPSARAAVFSFITLVTIFCSHDPAFEQLPCSTQDYVSAALKRYPYLMSEMTLDGLQTHMVLVSIDSQSSFLVRLRAIPRGKEVAYD